MTHTSNAGTDAESKEFATDSQQGVKKPSGNTSKPYPYSDSKSEDEKYYARDYYEILQGFKEYRKEEIVWLDAPGVISYVDASNPQTYEAKFIHYVSPCKCTSDLLIAIDKDGGVKTTFKTDCPKK